MILMTVYILAVFCPYPPISAIDYSTVHNDSLKKGATYEVSCDPLYCMNGTSLNFSMECVTDHDSGGLVGKWEEFYGVCKSK